MGSGFVAVFALLYVPPVFSQTITNSFGDLSENSKEPIDIASDLLTIYPEQHATFSGNVKAVQGTTTLRARELKVSFLGAAVGAAKQTESGEPASDTGSGGEPRAAPGNGGGELAAGAGAQPASKDGGGPETSTPPAQVSSPETAQSTKSLAEPIDIASDWLLIDDEKKYAQFKGNVKVKQGTTRLRAGELTVSYAGGDNLSANAQMSGGGAAQITKMEAKGDVRALLVPAGSAESKSPATALAGTKGEDRPPLDAPPPEGKPGDAIASNNATGNADTTSNSGAFDVASSSAKDSGATVAVSDQSERDSNKRITKIEATGDVVISSEKNETTSSDWVVYDLPLQLVTIGGNVLLTQNENVLKGDRLVVDLKTGESRFENLGDGSAGGGRIRALFMPKGSKPKGSKPEDPDKRDGTAKKLDRDAAPSQPAEETTVESPEPLAIVPEYR